MASITVRNLEEGLKCWLRIRAAESGRSMEEEARVILRSALCRQPSRTWRPPFAPGSPLGGVELEISPRSPMRKSPRFG